MEIMCTSIKVDKIIFTKNVSYFKFLKNGVSSYHYHIGYNIRTHIRATSIGIYHLLEVQEISDAIAMHQIFWYISQTVQV